MTNRPIGSYIHHLNYPSKIDDEEDREPEEEEAGEAGMEAGKASVKPRGNIEALKQRGDLGTDTPTGVPYIEEEIIAKLIKGKLLGHITGRGRKRDQKLDEAKAEAKAYRRELDEVLGVLKTVRPIEDLTTRIVHSGWLSMLLSQVGSRCSCEGSGYSGSGILWGWE
ncbi:hypothetical protein Tco_1196480 [Tanacetum coccineum]